MKILLFVGTLCTLLYFNPSDGAAVRRFLGKCPKNGYKRTVFDCTHKCNIKRARVFFESEGDVIFVGKTGPIADKSVACGKSCFCKGRVKRGRSKTCVKRSNFEINDGSVNFIIKCRKAATNVKMIVNGNVKIPPRQKPTTINLGHCIKEGQHKTAVLKCKGNCNIGSATTRFQRGGNVGIVGRVGKRVFTPLLCGRKCFCRGFPRMSNLVKCVKKKGHKITSEIVSFVLRCKKMTRNVRLVVYGNVIPHTRRATPEVVVVRTKDTPLAQKKFYIKCGARSCGMVSIKTSEGSGCLSLSAYSRNLCNTQSPFGDTGCTESNITNWNVIGNFIWVVLNQKSNQNFKNVKLTATFKMGTKAKISESQDVISKMKDKSDKNYVRVMAGTFEERFPYLIQYQIFCDNFNCKNLQISIKNGTGNVYLAVSVDPLILIHKNGFYNNNLLCTLKYPGSGGNICRNNNTEKFNITSRNANIALVPDPSFKDVEVHITGDNIGTGSPGNVDDGSIKYYLKDGTTVLPLIGPIKKGEHAHFLFRCRPKCTDSKIKVLSSGQFSILAGSSTKLDQFGNCLGCKCKDISSCETGFNPDAVTFYVTLTALVDLNDMAYITFTDSNKRDIRRYCLYDVRKPKSLLRHQPYAPLAGQPFG